MPILAPWNMGAAVFIWDQRGRFDAEGTLGMLETYPVTTFFAVPTAYRMLVLASRRRGQAKTLRHCVSGGEPVTSELVKAWKRATGLTIWEGFGQTEGVLCLATFPCMEYRPGSMGVAAPGF
jgi:acyl-coenzyme A synthetase/AMP-(fatty) acid ligase